MFNKSFRQIVLYHTEIIYRFIPLIELIITAYKLSEDKNDVKVSYFKQYAMSSRLSYTSLQNVMFHVLHLVCPIYWKNVFWIKTFQRKF